MRKTDLMIKVLTIDREYGSGAAEIAQQVAERLGWKLWDQLLTDEVAATSSARASKSRSMRSVGTHSITVFSKPSCAAATREP